MYCNVIEIVKLVCYTVQGKDRKDRNIGLDKQYVSSVPCGINASLLSIV